jgi:hypothetical protein
MEGTTSGRVETGNFSEVRMVLDCSGKIQYFQPQVFLVNPSNLTHVETDWCRIEVGARTLCSEELPRYVKCLAANDDYLLTIEELFRDSAGQATKQVSFAVNNNLVIRVSWSLLQQSAGLDTPHTTGSNVDILL